MPLGIYQVVQLVAAPKAVRGTVDYKPVEFQTEIVELIPEKATVVVEQRLNDVRLTKPPL